MKTATLRRVAGFANRSSEWLVLLFLLAAAIPPSLVRHRSLTAVPELNLDSSWLLDLSYKASGGIWLGRDVAFTYGPVFQWLSSAPARWMGISTGVIFATWYTLPLLLATLATLITARLLLPAAAVWRRALLLLLAVVFWSPPDVRVSLCLLAFATLLCMTGDVAAGRSTVWRSAAAAAVCVAAFWVSVDTGLYCSAALLACIAGTAAVKRRFVAMAKFLLAAATISTILVLLTNAVLSSSLFDFRYWRSAFAIAGGYRWFEAFSINRADKHLVLKTLALGTAVFAGAWRWRKSEGDWSRRPEFVVTGYCLALLFLQSALVRSDHGHVIVGIYPMIFLCGVIAMSELRPSWVAAVAVVVVVIATLGLASPYPRYTPRNLLMHARQMVHPILSCPAETREFDGNCFPPDTAALLSETSDYINTQIGPGDSIAIFPYETAFGLMSRHQVAGGVLQSYLAGGEYLTDLELAGLRRANPPFALYFPDGAFSIAIDEVPNFTRSPEVWFYLLRHYRQAGSPFPGMVGLTRDVNRAARLNFTEASILKSTAATSIHHRRASIPLALRGSPVAAIDFLKLRLKASYPFWWRVGKPSKLALELAFADGSKRTVVFLAEPNRAGDIWIFPWQSEAIAAYFADDPQQWRPGERPALVGLNLTVHPYDWASATPSAILVEDIEAVAVEWK